MIGNDSLRALTCHSSREQQQEPGAQQAAAADSGNQQMREVMGRKHVSAELFLNAMSVCL